VTLTDIDQLTGELSHPDTSHERRAQVGRRLADLGDPRPGVGLTSDGLPDIGWLPVGGGEVHVDDRPFPVTPFYIARYPITNSQFQAFVDDPGGYANPAWWEGLSLQHPEPGTPQNPLPNHPRDTVSWYDGVAFCRWLTDRLRPAPTEIGMRLRTQGWQIRLPTEWEWLQAATGGDPTYRYPWGAEWRADFTQPLTDNLDESTAVGLYPQGRSPVGALDMCSNLWEWCLNEYDNPERVAYEGNRRRVLRGGRWAFDVKEGTTIRAREFELGPYARTAHSSFRVGCCPP
jgi:formylglycine-generating enzyme required for sulfatase activity